MPPRRMVETRSWGTTCMVGRRGAQPTRDTPGTGPGAPAGSAGRSGPLLPLVPGAERYPLRAMGRELLGPHGDEGAVLPLEHVVLDARVGVLAGLVELHAPAVDRGADRYVHGQDGGAELVGVVGLGGVERQLQDPEPAAGELMPARDLGPGLGLDGLAEGALDPLPLGPHLLDDQARTGLKQREGPVGVIAERLAEARGGVAGRAGVHDGLDQEVLLARLPPEEDGVMVARDVVEDVGVGVLQLEDDRRQVVGGEGVILRRYLLHAELLLGALARGLGHTLAVRGILREVRHAQLARLLAQAGGQMLGDELDVVPAEPGAVDLGPEDVLEPALGQPRIDAGGLPVDDVLACRRLARRPAERGGEGAADDLYAFARGQPRRFGGGHGGVDRVPGDEGQLLAHHAAGALVDEVAHDLVALEVELALNGEIAG